MTLNLVDWSIIAVYLTVSLFVGVLVTRRAGKSTAEFFLSGRSMPWWLLGVSMVATTFSSDTPNLVTDMVRQHGVAGNWEWWAFLLTGMLTVFVYAKLWRRSGVLTDVEFYEIRYSGRAAAFLRGFRAIYLGVFFNVLIMASVTLAAIKISNIMLGWSPIQTVLVAGSVTLVYSTLGGLTGVLLTDCLLFAIAMGGAVAAAVVSLNQEAVGGLAGLLSNPAVKTKLDLMPDFGNTEALMAVFIIPLTVQWWSVWYPGSEPGGGGYVAQRMLAAKDENHAIGATLLFNVAHYALRPWPWILVALCSLIVFPDLASLREAFPGLPEHQIKNDMAYPAMLTFLPHGLLGFTMTSLIAAYMSTISTHLNWGSSYVVNDYYARFVRREASQKELVLVGRVTTLVLMVLASCLALFLSNSLQAFKIMLEVGAGTGLLFLLRWFWWRINALSELSAMVISFSVALLFRLNSAYGWYSCQWNDWQRLTLGVAITTAGWMIVTFLTRPTDSETLRRFCQLTRPGGPGWRKVIKQAGADAEATGERPEPLADQHWNVPMGILAMTVGCLAVYGALFATGYWLYGRHLVASVLSVVAVVASVILVKLWKRVSSSAGSG
ncbi:MAG: Na+:solute symporter [Pirellulales bacterium]|nr:Na+:solute symporter [Pirellulales bacterium]